MATRRRTSAPSRRRTPRRQPPRPGPGAVTIITWSAFALVGLVLAAGAAAILADDIPLEDRRLRDLRLRLRDRTFHASMDAIESLKHQFAELQSDVKKQIAHLR